MEHFIIIQLTDCLSPARPSFHLACLVFIYHLPVSGRIFKAKVVDINYNVRVRQDQLTGREDVRRKLNSVVSSFFVICSPAAWSTLIGRGISRLGSHWWRVLLAPALLCHKEPAQAKNTSCMNNH